MGRTGWLRARPAWRGLALVALLVSFLAAHAGSAAASSVTAPEVTLSSLAAGVTGVNYVVDLTPTTALGSSGTITVRAPSATRIPDQAVDVTDLTTGKDLGFTGLPTLQGGGSLATWKLGAAVPAGHRIELLIRNVTNPGAGGGQLLISTSSDPTPAGTSAFTLSAAGAVSSPAVSLTTPVQKAAGVTYLLDFSTSATGALAAGQGTVTVALPTGTVIPFNGVNLTDLTTGQNLGFTGGASFANGQATATWTVGGTAVPAGDRIELRLPGVVNTGATSGHATISTSSDTHPVSTSAFTLSAAGAVSSPAVSLTTPVQKAAGVTYLLDFSTSATGALAAGQGTVTVALPTGTVIPFNGVNLTDLTTGQNLGFTGGASFANGQATATWTVGGTAVPAGDRIELRLPGVVNTGATSGHATISTSSDTHPVSTSAFTLSAAGAVSSPAVSLTTPVQKAAGVTYLLDFSTSATGALAAGQGTVTVALPTGTVIPFNGVNLTDLTTGQNLGFTGGASFANGQATATWTVGGTAVPAGDRIELRLPGVVNTGATSGHATISTSSDTVPSDTGTFKLIAPGSVSSPTLAISDQGPGSTGVAYTFDFATSHTGTLAAGQGTVTVALPTGTVIPTAGADLTDLTTGQDLGFTGGATLTNGKATATWTVGGTAVPAGDEIQLTITNVTNPGTGTYQASISTSSDTTAASTPPFDISSSAQPPDVGPEVFISSTAAGATAVDYTFIFTTLGNLTANQGSITLNAPSGTSLPSRIDVFDLTTDKSLGTTQSTGTTGNAQTYVVTQDVPASHEIELTAQGVSNPPTPTSGPVSIEVGTSSQDQLATNQYSIDPAQSVSAPSVLLSSNVAGAKNVIYTTTFTTSSTGGLAHDQGTITLSAPAGTVLPNRGLDIFDLTTGQDLGGTFGPGATGNALTWSVATAIPAGHRIRLTLIGVTNPASGSHVLSVSTSSDTVKAPTSKYATLAAQAVSSPSVLLSSNVAGAKNVTYTTTFTTSSTGTLAHDQGTITLSAPAGTVLPNRGLDIFDLTTGQDLGGTFGPGATGNVLTWTVATGISAGDRIRLTLTGVTNPAAGTHTISVRTSSDTVPATSSKYATVAAQAVSSPTVLVSTPAAGAKNVTYTTTFTTSSTGTLAHDQGTITLSAPAGTVLPNRGLDIFDLTTGQDLGGTFGPGATGNVLTWTVATGISAGDRIRLTLTGVTNPAAGSHTISVRTSSDTVPATSSKYATVAAQAVSSPTVLVSTPAAGATGVTYTTTFTTSSTGTLAHDQGTITLSAPAGTVLPNRGLDIFDLTTGQDLGGTFGPGATGNVLTWTVATGISAGDRIRLTLTGVTNPAAGSHTISVRTSSDTIAATSAPYSIGTAHAVSAPGVSLSTPAPGAKNATYTITFKTSSSGGLAHGQGTITASAPAGTAFSSAAVDLFDLTTSTDLGATSAPKLADSGATATWTVGSASVPAGHAIRLRATGVANPSVAGTYELDLATSADTLTAQTAPYAVAPLSAPAVTAVSPTSGPAAGGTTVTVTGTRFSGATAVKFGAVAATSFTVDSSTQITVTAPAGTGTVDITVTTPSGTSAKTATDLYTYTQPSSPPPPPPPPASPPPSSAPSPGQPVLVLSSAPVVRGSGGAGFSGVVNPEGLLTTAFFQYGLDARYRGSGASGIVYDQSTGSQVVGSDFGSHTVLGSASGLVPNAIYHVRLVASNSSGTVFGGDQTFKTGRDRPPPAPVLGKAVNVKPVSGLVFIKPPKGKSLGHALSAHAALAKGRGFLPLTEARQIPTGSQIDSRQGTLQVSAASTLKRGKPQLGTFGGAIFKLAQDRRKITKGLTTLSLLEADFPGAPSFSSCKTKAHTTLNTTTPTAQTSRLSNKILQTLHSKVHGRFRTRGRYSAATVRGTEWGTRDQCNGTLTVVKRGTVQVQDFARHKTITLHAGHRYLAKPATPKPKHNGG